MNIGKFASIYFRSDYGSLVLIGIFYKDWENISVFAIGNGSDSWSHGDTEKRPAHYPNN